MTTTGPSGGAAGHDRLEQVSALLDTAIEAYQERPDAAAVLREQRERLHEPLRVALVGRVKAGKSTLLNALVGARIAPTDAGECTKVVTLYRHGSIPRVVLSDPEGRQRPLPVRRVDGGLQLDLAGVPPEEVGHLTVDWPAADLGDATFIDTPGISSLSVATSARTSSFLGSEDRMPGADAVVFLTRQLQADDLAFLSGFHERAGGAGLRTTTITVLSRADEIGAGRLGALLAAEEVAARMAGDPAVRSVTSTVLPVAGLLALAGRMLRHGDFVALRSVARAPQADAEKMLLTADRFVREEAPVPVAQGVRASLLDRLGMFGLRLSVALIRAGVDDAQSLADELVRRSGLAELQRLIAVHFTRRGAQLKIGTALRAVEALLRDVPVPAGAQLWGELERLQLASHDLEELSLLTRSRGSEAELPTALRAEGERLLGADGPGAAARLGLPEDSSPDDLRAAALRALERWRDQAADPLARRATRDAVAVVVHSCEAILAELDAGEPSAAGSAQPESGGPGEQGDTAQYDQDRLGEEGHPVEVRAARNQPLGQVRGDEAEEPDRQQEPTGP
jgi:hypothetical protein